MTAHVTLFSNDVRDLGEVKGLGHVVVREARIGELWQFIGGTGKVTDTREFPIRVLAASLVIDDKPVTFEQIMGMGVSRFRALQELLPVVMEINGLGGADAALSDAGGDEGEPENPRKRGAAA